ncbi:MAG: MerR family transcriptional regulator, partial [Mycobacteriales bacterium]
MVGVTAHTLRHYERIGLLTVARAPSDHRVYDVEAVRRVHTRRWAAGSAVAGLSTMLAAGPMSVVVAEGHRRLRELARRL